ncbi:MAG: phosphate/phosphite/phosphonate ABC transporter substrate-binding protein [Desulfobacterales bacterium]|nr:phosphate/phosphite/phosphonate ABC transporter substrate-binding protein [Desulfobacterales bacterium]
MGIMTFPYKRVHLIWLVILSMLVFSQGCGSDTDSAVVDFSKTVAVKRPGEGMPENGILRVSVGAMISPKPTFVYYRQLLDYIGAKLGLEAQLVQRKTYEETNQLFAKGQIDLAFLCSGPYTTGKEKYGFEALAVPQIRGKPFYQSYLIVNKDSRFHTLEDLRGRAFAFTDPDSNTGRLVPIYWLLQMGERPESFFKNINYTYGHDNSILAVAKALVDGAAVDSLIWEYYNQRDPIHASKTRIIKRSEFFGSPPVVVSAALPVQQKEHIRKLLFTMHQDPKGKKILNELMIEQFVAPKDEWYDSIFRMKQDLHLLETKPHATEKP